MTLLLATGLAAAALFATEWSPSAKAWWSHVRFLASDKLEGRKAGTEGYKKAVAYVTGEFKSAGLRPAGSEVFSQPVAFTVRVINEPDCYLQIVRNGSPLALKLGEDVTLVPRGTPGVPVEADAVFAGNALRIPEAGIDDLKGLDLRGKIAVYLSSAPKSVPGALAAHSQSTRERWNGLRKAGAIGVIALYNPKINDVPWGRSALARLQPSLTLSDPVLVDTEGMSLQATANAAHADLLLEGSGHTMAELLALDDAGKPVPSFALPYKIKAKTAFSVKDVVSDNVAGLIAGSDAKLKDEYVVVSAHLDHLGTGKPINGDGVYNGAMDNASGIASLIESAKILQGKKLKRSVLFLALTGEESGLLGSKYFAAHPTVPSSGIVADINMDMYLPIIPLKAVSLQGLEESDLGPEFAKVAERFGVEAKRDPEPERRGFIRSDQYSFIRNGIPSLAFKFYAAKGSPEYKVISDWRSKRYHGPSDDLQQPVNREGAAKFTKILSAMIEDVANRPDRPKWNASSFFRRFAEK